MNLMKKTFLCGTEDCCYTVNSIWGYLAVKENKYFFPVVTFEFPYLTSTLQGIYCKGLLFSSSLETS